MLAKITTFILLTILSTFSYSQSVGIGTNTPDPKAALDVQSDVATPQGMYIPRLKAAQRMGMSLDATNIGLLVYDVDSLAIMHWTGTKWDKLGGGSGLAKEMVTKQYTIPATAFIAYDTESDLHVAQKNNNGGVVYLKGSGESFAGAGVHLPDGATIMTVTLYSKDLVANSNNVTAELFRMDPNVSTTPQNVGTITSNSGTTGDLVTFVNVTSIVDNSKFMYWVQLHANGALGSTQNLGTYGVKITYTITQIK